MLIVPREAQRDVDLVSGVLDRLMILEGAVVPAMGAERLQVCIECARRESLGVWIWRPTEDWEDAAFYMPPTTLKGQDERSDAATDEAQMDLAVRRTLQPRPSDWSDEARSRSLEGEGKLLAELVDKWLRLAQLRPRASWRGTEPLTYLSTDVGTPGLVGLFAVELLAAFTGQLGVWRCDECHLPYEPMRKP